MAKKNIGNKEKSYLRFKNMLTDYNYMFPSIFFFKTSRQTFNIY